MPAFKDIYFLEFSIVSENWVKISVKNLRCVVQKLEANGHVPTLITDRGLGISPIRLCKNFITIIFLTVLICKLKVSYLSNYSKLILTNLIM